MMTVENNNDIIGLVLGVVSLIGVVFAVYKSYHVPQENIELKQAISEKEIGNKASLLAQKEMENKANILAEQFKMHSEANEKKFEIMATINKDAMAIAQNHIHTVDTKVDGLISQMGIMANEITKLSTIIEERIPRK